MKRPLLLWSVVDGVARAWVPEGTACGRCGRMAVFFVCRLGSWSCAGCGEE